MPLAYVEADLKGEIVRFEIDQRDFGGEYAVSGAIAKIEDALPQVQRVVRSMGLLLSEARAALHEQPSEITLEFGLNVKAEAGVLVANSSVEAQISVSMKWTQSK